MLPERQGERHLAAPDALPWKWSGASLTSKAHRPDARDPFPNAESDGKPLIGRDRPRRADGRCSQACHHSKENAPKGVRSADLVDLNTATKEQLE